VSPPRIIYVEDDPLVAFPIEIMLQEAGYDVKTFGTAEAALAELQSGARLDLLLTDVRLPGGLDGWAIAERARKLLPELPVIYASGDSAKEWKTKGVPDSVMLEKPFSFAMALKTVRNVLGQPA
jgi:CheY-like chemotaxis protein